ncbi:hypothetical protein B9T19_07405 [Ignatzschineria sp. F8392]|uniref:hypothetical protein n=1 Tax=Ignatzschineria sp. F8392 TaxID=1980117 RepID=UPI000B98FC54|nr:hypothetical protein [Ignatzschineria sp. F8392]OYQ78670.1 hypothetical protein B9T19_07405 [Ignatzschineria sp. F8392]
MEAIVIVLVILVAFSALRFVLGFVGKIASVFIKLVMRLVMILIFLGVILWVLDYYRIWSFKEARQMVEQQTDGFELPKLPDFKGKSHQEHY